MQPQRDLLAPSGEPLGTVEPPARQLALAAVAAAAAPTDAVRLQHRGADAMLLREKNRAAKPGVAGADDDDVRVHIARQRAVVLGWFAGGGSPVGARVRLARPGSEFTRGSKRGS